MSEPEERGITEHPGTAPLLALGLAAVLVVAGGLVGVRMARTGGADDLMSGAPVAPRLETVPANPTQEPRVGGFRLEGLPAGTVAQYTFARANADTYAKIPCFCGCGTMLGHRNLAECFVTPGGAWESHAAGCAVCLGESEMVMRMMSKQMSPSMMREKIVAEFGGPTMGPGSGGPTMGSNA